MYARHLLDGDSGATIRRVLRRPTALRHHLQLVALPADFPDELLEDPDVVPARSDRCLGDVVDRLPDVDIDAGERFQLFGAVPRPPLAFMRVIIFLSADLGRQLRSDLGQAVASEPRTPLS